MKLGIGRCTLMLPNGMPIYFPELQKVNAEWMYRYGKEWRRLFGGKLLENITQALARIIVMDAAARIRQRTQKVLALQVHDELDYVVHKAQSEDFRGVVQEEMLRLPEWAGGLPLAVEIKTGHSFGDCK